MPTFDTLGPIVVSLHLRVGDLRIMASDRDDTVVDVQPSDPAKPADVAAGEQTRVEYANGVLEITAPRTWRRYASGRAVESIDVHIAMPIGSQLRGEAGVAALRSTGTLGECRYKTGAGDITVEHVAGAAELTTGTGVVRIDRIGGSARVKNANGDTWIGEVIGDLHVQAANGGIAVDQAQAAVTAKTANGDIHLDEVARGVTVARTARGNVDVAVRGGVAVWLNLHTGFGRVDNRLGAGEPPKPAEDIVEVQARSAFGDITIRRSDTGDSGYGAA